MAENIKWKWCAVGNIVRTRIDENGVLRHGTAAFSGGTKVYLCGKYWGASQSEITVIGLSRARHFRVCDVPVELIENVRLSQVFKPKVLEIMDNFEFWDTWWQNTEEDRAEAASFVSRWNSVRQEGIIE